MHELVLLAPACGWIEGSVVVFLSDLSVLDGEPARVYRLTDAAVLFASARTTVAAFLAAWRLAAGQQVPERFHASCGRLRLRGSYIARGSRVADALCFAPTDDATALAVGPALR